jgi:hypothetical protein
MPQVAACTERLAIPLVGFFFFFWFFLFGGAGCMRLLCVELCPHKIDTSHTRTRTAPPSYVATTNLALLRISYGMQ